MRNSSIKNDKPDEKSHVKVVEQGACSVKGRRQYQEDSFGKF